MKTRIRDFFMYNNMDCMGWRWKKRFPVLLGLLIASPCGYCLWKIWTVILPQMDQASKGMTDSAGSVAVGGILGLYIGIMMAIVAVGFASGMTLFLIGVNDGFKTKKW
jgi:hypothetical protein